MKKFYSIVLSVAVALTVSATAAGIGGLRQPAPVKAGVRADGKMNVESKLMKNPLLEKIGAQLSARQLSKAKAEASTEGIEGECTIAIGDYYFEESQGDFTEVGEITVEEGVFGTKKAVIDCEYFPTPVSGVYNASTGIISLAGKKIGPVTVDETTTLYIQFTPFVYQFDEQTEEGKIVPQGYSVTFEDGKIEFPADHGFAWMAYADADYSEFAGYVDLFDVLWIQKGIPDPNEGWKSVGMATFADPWVLSCYGIDATADTQYQYEVELQQSEDDAFEYRLVDPYHGNCPAANMNESTTPGYIQFNISDPDHVTFSPVVAGFASKEMGISKFYCLNTLSLYVGALGYSPDVIVSVIGDKMPYTTYKDGVVTLSSAMVPDEAGNMGLQYDACFGIQNQIYGGLIWTDDNNNVVPMLGFIKFPGSSSIAGVTVDENAPVKYYNLQGVEVARPAAGQMVIRVQGSKTEKMIVR